MHPKDILHDKNHLYRIVLIHLTSNVAFKTRKHFSDGWILIFFKTIKPQNFVSLSHCLTTFASLDAK